MAVDAAGDVEHIDGHRQTYELSAMCISQRAGHARWLATRDCSGCWQTERDRSARRQRDEWLATRRGEDIADTEAWEILAEMPLRGGSERAVDSGCQVDRGLLGAFCQSLGAAEACFAARIVAPARLISLASWWTDQRDSQSTDLEELLSDAGSNWTTPATENPY